MGSPVTIPLWHDSRPGRTAPATSSHWAVLGSHGCWGMPDVFQDPAHRDSYLVTWQRYRDATDEQVMDVKYAVYSASDHSCSEERYLFDHRGLTSLQAHPCCGYWNGQHRVFYCACRRHDPAGRVVEISAGEWTDHARYAVSDCEPAVTPELGFHPHLQFLPVDESTAWLFYTNYNRPDRLWYSRTDARGRWDQTSHPIPTSLLVGDATFTMGSALLEDGDVVLYSSVCQGPLRQPTPYDGAAYRFRYNARRADWAAEPVVVEGIDEPFKSTYGGELFVRVIQHQGRYFLSAQSGQSHRYLAAGSDGTRFRVIADFGPRPSWGNALVGIDGTHEVLLIYAGQQGGELGGLIEAVRVSV